MAGKRGGRGRKKANTVNYHGVVITGAGNSRFMYNINSLFSNYAIRGKVTNAHDPLARSALYKAFMHVIKKRREEIKKEKSELNKIPEKNSAVRKRYEKKIDIHEKILGMYNQLAKSYKGPLMNTKGVFNILRVNYGKRPASVPNKGYRYYSVPSKNPQKINA
jgi:hypothetical protein